MKPSILIVDDEKVICDGLSRLFEDDYTTYKACNGIEAIDIINNNEDIAVMLCDIKMPEMEGNELIDRIRTEKKDMYIIVITAAATPLKICDAMKKGANCYIRKPFNVVRLKDLVHRAVKSKMATVAMNN